MRIPIRRFAAVLFLLAAAATHADPATSLAIVPCYYFPCYDPPPGVAVPIPTGPDAGRVIVTGRPAGFILMAVDAVGRPATGYSGTITFGSSDPGAMLPAPLLYQNAVAVGARFAFNSPGNDNPSTRTLSVTDAQNGLSGSYTFLTGNAIPRFDHVVVVIMENHSAGEIYASVSAPYINGTLIAGGAAFSSSFGVTHPSQPNYVAMFSGSTQGVIDDSCPQTINAGNLGQQLIDAGLSFAQFSEGLPATGDTSCTAGLYARKHNAPADFVGLPTSANQPFANFGSAVANSTLPTVTFVAPNLCNDMHGAGSCTGMDLVALGDQWLQNNLPQYLSSPAARNGLLIVTWDEDDSSGLNQIPTIFYGAHVKPGYASATTISHYNLLRTLEDMYGLTALGAAAAATPITDVWDDVIFRDGFQ